MKSRPSKLLTGPGHILLPTDFPSLRMIPTHPNNATYFILVIKRSAAVLGPCRVKVFGTCFTR